MPPRVKITTGRISTRWLALIVSLTLPAGSFGCAAEVPMDVAEEPETKAVAVVPALVVAFIASNAGKAFLALILAPAVFYALQQGGPAADRAWNSLSPDIRKSISNRAPKMPGGLTDADRVQKDFLPGCHCEMKCSKCATSGDAPSNNSKRHRIFYNPYMEREECIPRSKKAKTEEAKTEETEKAKTDQTKKYAQKLCKQVLCAEYEIKSCEYIEQ